MRHYQLIVIGGSVGSVDALKILLDGLEKNFPLPIAVVLHRGKDSDEYITTMLQKESRLTVVEAYDKQPIERGYVYIAPPDYHLLIEEKHFALSTDEPVHYSRPSIDVLFESATDAFGDAVIGVIMTGGSRDGAQGLAAIKQAGGVAIVQDPKTAENKIMPEAAIEVVKDVHIVPIYGIGKYLMKLIESS